MLKAGIIGFGGIAKAHRKAYANLKAQGKVELVAACDIDPNAFTRKVKINIDAEPVETVEDLNFYTDLDEMLEKEQLDLVSICVPSFLHSEITVKVLRSGVHVMCEKPMALSYADCEKMMCASEESGKELMIGQCLRFYPVFDYVKDVTVKGTFGKMIGAFFQRISAPPIWGWQNWFMDPERSGGCITDLHIHDVDIIRYLFGEPDSVSCHASTSICRHDTVHTTFFYDGTPITAVGDWTLTGIPFQASCRINYEKATVVVNGTSATVYPKDGSESYDVKLPKISGHEGELSYFADVVAGKIKNEKNPASSAATTVSLVEHMRRSADAKGAVLPFTVG